MTRYLYKYGFNLYHRYIKSKKISKLIWKDNLIIITPFNLDLIKRILKISGEHKAYSEFINRA